MFRPPKDHYQASINTKGSKILCTVFSKKDISLLQLYTTAILLYRNQPDT